MSPDHEIVLVAHGDLGSGAFEAHLLGLARQLSPLERVHLCALASPRFWLTRRGRAARRRLHDGIRPLLSGSLALVPHSPRGRFRGWDAAALARACEGLGDPRRPRVLHCRGAIATAVAGEARRRRRLPWALLHDVRAARSEEVAVESGTAAARAFREVERRAAAIADAHACVSTPLSRWLTENLGVGGAEVFPCAADTERFRPDEDARHEARSRLGVGARLLVGFVGDLAAWQAPGALPPLLRAIRRHEPEARLLVLTRGVAEAVAALRAAGLAVTAPPEVPADDRPADAHVRFAPHAEVPGWLAACDLTLLVRARDAINAVASPIKFAESLACGVPVVASEGLGDASGIVRETGVGVVLDGAAADGPEDHARVGAFLGRLTTDRPALAAACRKVAVERLSWREQVPRWLALHARLAEVARRRLT